ncbi:DMT family transporter [Thalassobaculum sp.]|uniref:DMT family transporter n=1 Tax=Thalassobaculum sp. TaxID=2022740 RepID=UPI003B5C60A6
MPTNSAADPVKGLTLAVLGVLILTPDTVLMRLVGADPWTILFWRGLLVTVGYAGLLAVRYRGGFLRAFAEIGSYGALVAVLFAINTILFVVAVATTTVANTLVIMSAAPLFAALIGRAFLGERPPARTWIAIGIAIAGIVVIVGDGLSVGTWIGDLTALAAAIALGGHFVLVRAARPVDMMPAVGLSGLLVAAVSLIVADSLTLTPVQFGWMALLGLIILPVSFGLLTLAPIYLSAAEVGLVVLLETVLGPLWVWLVMGEEPSVNALIGGAIVITALVMNFVLKRRTLPAAPHPETAP